MTTGIIEILTGIGIAATAGTLTLLVNKYIIQKDGFRKCFSCACLKKSKTESESESEDVSTQTESDKND